MGINDRVLVIESQASKDWAHELDDLIYRWMIRRNINKWSANDIRKMTPVEFRSYLDGMSREQLIELRNDLNLIMDNIEFQTRGINPKLCTPGTRGWFFSALAVKKKCGRYIQVILEYLTSVTKLLREKNRAQSIRFERMFMVCAKEILDPRVYESIMVEAGNRAGRK